LLFYFRLIILLNEINVSYFNINEDDLVFIGEMIEGTPEEMRQGRKRDKSFLYDIVSNSLSGFDVDRVDYLLRDSHMTSGPYSVSDLYKFIERARVLPAQPIAPMRPQECSDSQSQRSHRAV
jgi:HD superfamily phosphohydrolase